MDDVIAVYTNLIHNEWLRSIHINSLDERHNKRRPGPLATSFTNLISSSASAQLYPALKPTT
jgi:hypothetical protein